MSVQLQPFFSTETTSTTSCTNKNVLYWPDSIRNCFSWRTNALVPRKQPIKDVSLHALITRNLLQFKLRNMTNVACFHGQHSSFCLPLQLHWKKLIRWEGNQRTKESQDMIFRVQRESYSDIKLIHIMSTDSLWSITGVNNHWKDVILFSKTFLDGWTNQSIASLWHRILWFDYKYLARCLLLRYWLILPLIFLHLNFLKVH